MFQKNIGTEKAWQKIKHYCAYQERSHVETKEKLYSFGLYKQEVEELLSRLIEENYLNEERYAIAFAGGKFRMKQWGRIKIKYELQQKRVSSYCVKKALSAIPESDYAITLRKLAESKLLTLKSERNIFIKRTKLRNYLLQKGFEPNLIMEIVQGL
ncbi:MAG: RecX family transcriptional regulator [Chitinophagaceae bacterium]|nr:MAG: RecX family transcriptional regulator [Chitinophagaceae bacterium]